MAHNSRVPMGNATQPPRAACKICGCSIFINDVTRWVTSPNPGLAHDVCAEETPPAVA